MHKISNCFLKIQNHKLNTLPSLLIMLISSIFFYYVQYILNNYIMNATDSFYIFFIGSIGVYFLYYFYNLLLEYFSSSYRNIKEKSIKYYILSNLIKSSLLFIYTPNAIYILYKTIYCDEWNNIEIKNMGSLYSIPDFVSLFMVKNMHRSTKIHHLLVVFFYSFNLLNDYRNMNIFRPLVIYTIFSTFSYTVNFVLAFRFLKLNKIKDKILPYIFLLYLTCCSINWTWNIYYIYKLIQINNHFTIYLYILFISFIVWDDIVLMKWLRYKSKKINNK